MLKRYPIRESRLYKLNSKKRLAALLNIELGTLRNLIRQGDNYQVFSIQQGPGKSRTVEAPRGQLKEIHSRFADVTIAAGAATVSALRNQEAFLPHKRQRPYRDWRGSQD